MSRFRYPLPHVRWMIRRDLPQVEAILKSDPIAAGAYDLSIPSIREYLTRRECIGLVSERGDDIFGFVLYEHTTQDRRPKAIHLSAIFVHADHRRTGIGTSLSEKLKGKLSEHGRRLIHVTVHEADLGALNFLKANRFRATHLEHGLFGTESDPYDGIAMRFHIRDRYGPAAAGELGDDYTRIYAED